MSEQSARGDRRHAPHAPDENPIYPRRGAIRLFRNVLLVFRAVLLFYAGNAVWNIYQLAHASLAHLRNLRAVWSALVLPWLFATPDAPVWAMVLGTAILGGLVVLCVWAGRDRAAEWRALAKETMTQVAEQVVETRTSVLLPPSQGTAWDAPSGMWQSAWLLHPPADDRSLTVPPRLVGRDNDVAWVVAQFQQTSLADQPEPGERVCALDGLAGMGKTAVAAVAVRQLRARGCFADGVAVIDCATISSIESRAAGPVGLRHTTTLTTSGEVTDGSEDSLLISPVSTPDGSDSVPPARHDSLHEQVLREIVRRFTVGDHTQGGNIASVADTSATVRVTETITQVLTGRDALIILDHVDAGVVKELEPILQPLRATDVAVLILTQVRLAPTLLALERCRSLSALSAREAAELYLQALGRTTRAEAPSRGESLSPVELGAVRHIVEALGGHPLALVLAGAYTAQVMPDLLAAEQTLVQSVHGLDLPAGEVSGLLRHLFATTYQALPRDAQRLFVALAAFAARDVGRSALLALAGELRLAQSERAVTILIQRRLLDIIVREDMPSDSDRQRLQLHPLLYDFAQEKYARWEQNLRAQLADALADFYATYVTQMTPPGRAGDDALGADSFQMTTSLEWALGRGVSQVSQAQAAVALGAGLANTWYLRGEMASGLRIFPEVIALAQRLVHEPTDSAAAETDEPVDSGIFFKLARLFASYGAVLEQVGRWSDATAAYQQSLAYHIQAGTERGAADIETSLGQLEMLQMHLQASENQLREVLVTYRAHGDWQGEANALTLLGSCANLGRDRAAAKRYFRQSLRIVQAHAGEQDERATMLHIGMIAQEIGQVRIARKALSRCLQLAQETHVRAAECVVLCALGSMDVGSLRVWRWRAAEHMLQQSRALARDMHSPHREAAALYWLAHLKVRQLRVRQAEEPLRACLALLGGSETDQYVAARTEAQLFLGLLLCRNHETVAKGRDLLQQALATRRTLALPPSPWTQLAELVLRFGQIGRRHSRSYQ